MRAILAAACSAVVLESAARTDVAIRHGSDDVPPNSLVSRVALARQECVVNVFSVAICIHARANGVILVPVIQVLSQPPAHDAHERQEVIGPSQRQAPPHNASDPRSNRLCRLPNHMRDPVDQALDVEATNEIRW
eukprot:4198314-Pyramimonas_sp.AAC.1